MATKFEAGYKILYPSGGFDEFGFYIIFYVSSRVKTFDERAPALTYRYSKQDQAPVQLSRSF